MNTPAIRVNIPLLNPNEPESRIVSLAIAEGQYVQHGELLCTLETTKSTAEVLAEREGFIIGLNYAEGDTAYAGSQFCYLASDRDWQPDAEDKKIPKGNTLYRDETGEIAIPEGLRISKPALELALRNNLDLEKLPFGPLVTENIIREYLDKPSKLQDMEFESIPSEIIVYGGGGHGKSVIDTILAQGIYNIHGIVDDGLDPNTSVMGIPVFGNSQILPDLFARGIRQAANAVGGIGDISSRIKIFQLLAEQGFVCPPIIHPSAVVERSTQISSGVQIFPQAYIGSEVSLGFGVIVNTGAVVSHDCKLDTFANISPGAILAGGVTIGQGTLVGMGVTINLGVSIGEYARIGNSATIKSDVPDHGIVRAGMIWPD